MQKLLGVPCFSFLIDHFRLRTHLVAVIIRIFTPYFSMAKASSFRQNNLSPSNLKRIQKIKKERAFSRLTGLFLILFVRT
ncbi:MAG: hypothetical protein ACBZ72_09220 [Candidatus Bathyarchaeia archaeon]